jgi:hypothetical protein
MPFSFLNAWFWLGTLALAAPLWLHLRRKQQTNLLHFSAVRFLEDQPQPRRSALRLSRVALFALRVLALLLLVAAFAWPYLRLSNTLPIRESRVYILDNTLSHQTHDGFTRDRQQVVNELNRAGSDLQIAVIELTSTPRVAASFSDDRETARQRIEALPASFERGSYLAAFRLANSMLANSLGDQKRIIFLGDNQENQWNENLSTPPFLHNVQIDLPKAPSSALPNLSLSEPHSQRVFLGDRSLVNCTVKLTHVGDTPSADVILQANGQSVLNRKVDLTHQPETILLQAQWEADSGTWVRGEVTVDGPNDALTADNKVFFSLPPVVEGQVALLAQSPYLRLALSPEIMRGRWLTRILEPAKLGPELTTDQDSEVLCIESDYLQSREARKLLWRYLTKGRGVLLLVNRVTPAVDGCLRELGFDVDGAVQVPEAKPEMFQFIYSNHPIFQAFLSPEFGSLMDIRVWQYARLRAVAAMPLIFSQSGAGLFFQGTRFPGKLFVSAFGLDRDQSSWPIHQTFIPFLDLALQAARSEDPTPTTFEPGAVARLQLPPTLVAHEVVLRDEGREVVRSAVEQGKAQLRMPGKPGIYSLTCDESDRVQKMLSVNPSPKESQLTFVNAPEALKVWKLNRPAEGIKPAIPAARAPARLAGILQQRLWWWILMGGLLALWLEMALAEPRKENG